MVAYLGGAFLTDDLHGFPQSFHANAKIVPFTSFPILYSLNTHPFSQGFTNPEDQVAMATKFCMVPTNICEVPIRELALCHTFGT